MVIKSSKITGIDYYQSNIRIDKTLLRELLLFHLLRKQISHTTDLLGVNRLDITSRLYF